MKKDKKKAEGKTLSPVLQNRKQGRGGNSS
jgi:hypothetical protein